MFYILAEPNQYYYTMRQQEIITHLFNEFKKDFSVHDFFDEHGEGTQVINFNLVYEYQDEYNGWHLASMEVVGAIYMKTGEYSFQSPLSYGEGEDVSDPNTIEDWDILNIQILIDNKDVTTTEHFKQLCNLTN